MTTTKHANLSASEMATRIIEPPYKVDRPKLKLAHEIDHVQFGLLKTPFYQRAKTFSWTESWGNWNGYANALSFKDPYVEYFSTRNTCGVYDVSAMCKYRIRGKDAEAMLNRMVTRDVSKQGVGKVAYNVWCNDRGRVIDDGTLFRFAEDDFRLYCAEPNLDWLMLSSAGYQDLEIFEESDDIAGLALQGPTSCALLRAMGLGEVENLKPMELNFFPFPIKNPVKNPTNNSAKNSAKKPTGEIMISRTGFTGDLGYELWVKPELALTLWDELFDVGQLYGLMPFGEEALNMARIEAGFILPEVEFHGALHSVKRDYDHSPFELSLDWMVNFNKPHYNGRQALLEEKEKGPKYRLLKLDIEGQKVAEGSIMYSDKACRNEIGYVTSALLSPATKANIAMALIKGDAVDGPLYAEIYYQTELRWHRKVSKGTIRTKPFWSPDRARATPPGNC